MNAHAARADKRASKSQSNWPAGGASLIGRSQPLAADNLVIKALAEFKGAMAELKDQAISACRVPEQCNGRVGCGNANGEKDTVR